MMNGVTNEFGQVLFDGARVRFDQMAGAPGEGWALAMTIVSHEREPAELGYSARYGKLVRDLVKRVGDKPLPTDLAWAVVQSEMLRLHVRRRLSERLDGVEHDFGYLQELSQDAVLRAKTIAHGRDLVLGMARGRVPSRA